MDCIYRMMLEDYRPGYRKLELDDSYNRDRQMPWLAIESQNKGKRRGKNLTSSPTSRQLLCSLPLSLPFGRAYNAPILDGRDQKPDVGIEKVIPNVPSPKGYVVIWKLMAVRVHEATAEIVCVESGSGHFSHCCCITPCCQTDVREGEVVVGHVFLGLSTGFF